MFCAFLVSLVVAAPAPEEKKPVPGEGKVIKILAEHKLYKLEPGQEKEFVGMIQKDAQAGYSILMQAGKAFGKEKLVLYGDAGDPLAPFVGKKVRLFGKQVSGAVGFRTFQHTLPGRLEVLAEKEEGK